MFLKRKLKRSTSTSSIASQQSQASVGSTASVASNVSRVSVTPKNADETLSTVSSQLSLGAGGYDLKPWTSVVSKKVLAKLPTIEKRRQQVLHEIFVTEQAYLRDLVVIKNLFRQTLLDEGACEPHTVTKIFSNLDQVIAVNGELYELLKAQRKDHVFSEIGHIFLDLLERHKFDVYLTFCANQTLAIEIVAQQKKNNARFADVMARCEAKVEESGGFDLPSFLLKGMQRLLKYQPLLENAVRATTPAMTTELRNLQKAINLMGKVAFKVNDAVRESENARRLPALQKLLVVESLRPWVGRPDFNTNLTSDPTRKLLMEGPLKLIRHTAGGERKLVDMHLILLSDMLLMTVEREGRYLLRETREVTPVVKINNITDIRGETNAATRERTTLMLEVGAPARELHPPPSPLLVRDSPRPVVRPAQRRHVRLEAPTAAALKTWVVELLRAREHVRAQHSELERTRSRHSIALPEGEFAVTLLVSTVFEDDGSMRAAGLDQVRQQVPDWEISFEQGGGDSGATVVETTRHVRVFQGPEGLGMTLIGKSPVRVQEVEEDGPAFAAGIRADDVIRAVNGEECTAMSHEDVVRLIRDALLSQRREWQPVEHPLPPIPDDDSDDIARAAYTRGPHKTKKMTFLMDI